MNCRRCGGPITGKEEFCPQCGERASTAVTTAITATAGPRGVSGLLLVLCVPLTIVFPLNTLYATVNSLHYHPDAGILFLNATNVALALLSLVAGYMLWSTKKVGVKLAKIFFVLTPLHSAAILFLVVSNLHTLQARVTVLLAMRILAVPLLLSVACYLYLVESRRVKNTYGGK